MSYDFQTDEEWANILELVALLGWKDGEEIGANYPSYWYPPSGDPVHKSWNPFRDRNESYKLLMDCQNRACDPFTAAEECNQVIHLLMSAAS